MEKVREYSENEFGLFLVEELVDINDIELVILKGHLFTEFTINCYLESISKNENSNFFKENFSYSSKIKLLNYFGLILENQEALITALTILNKIRNTIAHSLIVNKQLIDEFFAILKKMSPKEGSFNNANSNDLDRMIGGIAFVSGIIFGKYIQIKK